MTARPVWKPVPPPSHLKTAQERFTDLLGRLLRVPKDDLQEERQRDKKRKTEKDESG